MLADAGLFHFALDLPKGESHLLTQRCGAGGEAARREGACSGTDVVVSFHFFFPIFFSFASSVFREKSAEPEHTLEIFSLVCATKTLLLPWGEVICVKSL